MFNVTPLSHHLGQECLDDRGKVLHTIGTVATSSIAVVSHGLVCEFARNGFSNETRRDVYKRGRKWKGAEKGDGDAAKGNAKGEQNAVAANQKKSQLLVIIFEKQLPSRKSANFSENSCLAKIAQKKHLAFQ